MKKYGLYNGIKGNVNHGVLEFFKFDEFGGEIIES